ncbi:hypothetical protein vseg_008727 [Gypsophila vaccaria]
MPSSTTTLPLPLPLIFFFFVVVVVSAFATASNPTPIPGLDSFLSQQYSLDPQASNDTLLSLPSRLKALLSTSSPPSTSSLLSLNLPTSLHVTLVGPSFSPSSPQLLSSFLTPLLPSPFHLISPSSHVSSHSLAVSHSLHVSSSISPSSLSSSLSSAVSSSLNSSVSPLRSTLSSVPFSLVDDIISSYHLTSSPHPDVISLYVISLPPPPKPYAYSFSSSPSPDSSSPGFTKCLGTLWTGASRYFWIDLSAGPVDYGPALSGDGVLPRGGHHPLNAAHGKPRAEKSLILDIASLISSAYRLLLVPSLRIPVPYETSLVIQFIHIHDNYNNNIDIGGGAGGGLDWGVIERSFVDEARENGVLFKDQSLNFKKYEIRYKECGLCGFAVSKSISSYTSRFLFDNYTLIASEYVDSKKLHQILVDSADEFKRLGGIEEEDDFGRVLPVYVFDLDRTMLLLLDRFHQSVAFKDMVIAIRTRNTQTVSDYSCNGRHVFTQTRELERPLIGSILQSMWGVSPTHLTWSPTHNSTLVDYTWSVGQTPFGPFSEISSLSFVQKDAARRNVLLTSLNYSISSAIEVLESVKAHGGYRELLKGQKHTEFSQRWTLFKYKIDKMISALSHLDFELASYYLRSSDHDLYAMHSIVYHASQEVDATLTCFRDPPVPWGSVSMSATVFVLLCYVYVKREKFFKNKRKQF